MCKKYFDAKIMENNSAHVIDDLKLIDQLNDELVENLYLPFIYILGFYMFCGVFGNSTVLYIYLVKFRTYRENRFFIPPLAAIDSVACVINCSILISWISSPIKHGTDIECKIKSYLCMASIMVSILILVIIAIDRYLKICRPLGKQIDLRWKRRSIGITIIAAMVLSLPFLVFNGAVKHTYPGTNVTAINCWDVDYGTPAAAMFSYGLYLLIVLAELGVMSVLYFRICRRIFQQKNFKPRQELSKISSTPDNLNNLTNLDMVEDTHSSKDAQSINIAVRFTEKTVRFTTRQDSHEPGQSVYLNTLPKTLKKSVRKIPRSRLTIMFLMITIVFAISFIPRVVILVLESMGYDFSGLSQGSAFFLELFRSVYIANNLTNPFFYSCMDKKFQLELRKLCCCNHAQQSRKSFARISTMLYKRDNRNEH